MASQEKESIRVHTSVAMQAKPRAKRDPEARRRAIEQAAAELLLEGGSQRLTHRKVAERAQVPLGSTTQYFSSIDDLRRAGYAVISRAIEQDYQEMIDRIHESKGDIRVIASCLVEYMNNEEEIRADVILYSAAVRDPELMQLASMGLERFVQSLKTYLSEEQANAVAIFIDGAFVEAGIFGRRFSEAYILQVLQALTQATYTTSAHQ